jgi:hypothetical protein
MFCIVKMMVKKVFNLMNMIDGCRQSVFGRRRFLFPSV